jgi:ubiquinone/menaquinone biosynthesis C-methylase UbiE
MSYEPQVASGHYERASYRSQDRWDSYWHQLDLIREVNPKTVLEVGLGEGVVADHLKRKGIAVTTVDIAADLHPDVVGSVTELPFKAGAFDVVLAAEILEHIRFDDVPKALSEIARVARTHAVISLPHPGYVFSFVFKLPLLPRIPLFFKIPFFWQTHTFNGEHYWELGKRTYSVDRFLRIARRAGLSLRQSYSYADDPSHRFFLFFVER